MNNNDATAMAQNDKCHLCGSEIGLSEYNQKEKLVQKMKNEHICFKCAFWKDKAEHPAPGREIINGTHYMFNKWNSDDHGFRGCGGSSHYILRTDGTVVRSNNVWIQGDIPNHFLDLLPDTAKFITREAYNKLKDNVSFKCERKGCFDRYHCYFYHADEMEKNGAWNKVPLNHVVGSEECELFLDKDKVFK